MLLHFQASSSVPCYSPAVPSRGLGDDVHVYGLSSVAAVDLEKSCKVKTSIENPAVSNAGMFPWQNTRRSLQLGTSVACC